MKDKQEKIFFEIHKDIPREGPGSSESTKKAYSLLNEVPESPVILDVGCGPGKQTFDLAKLTNGKIFALDNHKSYLNQIDKKVKEQNISNRIITQLGDMNNLPFDKNIFDIIWAEGSVYIMGIGRALELWKKHLKTSGYIVFSELCWLKNERPEEIENYWNSFYGQMQSVDSIIKFLIESDYKFIGSYTLPDKDWWDDYYTPLMDRINKLKEKYSKDKEALEILNTELTETEIHRKYSAYYGYSFFIIQRN
ncbi:MAG: class I SAM-dependent methyltransferase [Melioribacteraceae bacterium]|nr:class I SAM-dependent methyltransferase [Melioribacteraceae bacterium]